MQQEQDSVVWQNFDFLFEALHATGFTGEGDLSEAAAVEIRCVVLPGEGLHGLQPVLHFIPLWRRNGKCESEFSQKRDKDNSIKSHRGQETISFPNYFYKVNVYERFQDKRPHLPQGFSTVVLSLKIFSKLYRLSTSSLSVSNSIQPLKLGRASWGGGWKTKNKDKELDNMCTIWIYIWTHDSAPADAYWMCMNTPTLTMTEPIPATKAHSRLCTYFESTRVSSHVENGVVGQQVEQPLISSSRPVGFEGSFDLLRAFWRHGHVAVLEDPAFRHTERKILIHTFPFTKTFFPEIFGEKNVPSWVFSPLRKVKGFCFPWFFSGNVCLQSVFRIFICLMWNQVKLMETQICHHVHIFMYVYICYGVCGCPTFPARYCWSFHQTWCLEVSAPRQFLLRRWSTSAASSPPASCPGTPYWTTNTRRTEMNYKHPSKTPRCHQKHQIKRHKKSSSVAVAMLTSLLPR